MMRGKNEKDKNDLRRGNKENNTKKRKNKKIKGMGIINGKKNN
tara:strand:- start:639 stop:767 length:129 start_codon:yes stop_codon:yes gene_type:complete